MSVYIYDAGRTPFGRHAGVLAGVRPDDLLGGLISQLIKRNPFDLIDYEDVVAGCASQAGEDARNVARHAALLAGLPVQVGGLTVNRLCGSGLAAILDAARAIRCEEGDLFLAGGVESMSRAPFVVGKADAAFSRKFEVFDSSIGARFPNSLIEKQFGSDTMPETADNVARQLGISRDDCDAFALRSQIHYSQALAAGHFESEVLAVQIQHKKKPPVLIEQDEHPRPDTTLESLSRLMPLYEGGVVTPGNASGINDGAAAVIMGNSSVGQRHDMRPRARLLAGAVAGVEPRLMGLGPVNAIKKALLRAGLKLSDMDVIEINEAFAAQVLGCTRSLGLADDDPRLNPKGGAIALGHPLGASGARLVTTALHFLEQTGGRFALVSLCIGLGQGIACVLERCESHNKN